MMTSPANLRLDAVRPTELPLLAVGLPGLPARQPGLDITAASTGAEALALLRLISFDLLLAGQEIPDMTVWALIRVVRARWPQQRWALLGRGLTARQEIQARSLGAVMVINGAPDCECLHSRANLLLGRPGRRPALPRADRDCDEEAGRRVGMRQR